MEADAFRGMKVLVTGGAGFFGSHIVDALVHGGAEVSVIDNLSTGRRENLAGVRGAVRFVEGDILSRDDVLRAMDGVSHVVHAAAFVSVPESLKDPVKSHEVNVTGTLMILKAAHEQKVKRLVYISSSAVYGSTDKLPAREDLPMEPESPYAAQKAAAESYVHLFGTLWGIETIRLRPFNIYGPRQNPEGGYAAAIPKFASLLMRKAPPTIFGDGSATRDFVYVGDAVNAVLLSLVAPDVAGSVFNVAGGVETPVAGLLAIMKETAGVDVTPSYEPPRPGDIVRSVADTTRAEEGLGFRAVTPLKEGLGKTMASFSV